MSRPKKSDAATRIAELCVAFKLPTIGAELCKRLLDAGFGDAGLELIREGLAIAG